MMLVYSFFIRKSLLYYDVSVQLLAKSTSVRQLPEEGCAVRQGDQTAT